MRSLTVPDVTFQEAIDACVAGIGSAVLAGRYQSSIPATLAVETGYSNTAKAGDLYALPRVVSAVGSDPIVCGVLTKSEMTKLYTSYFVPQGKPGRTLYEKLLVTANGKCPFCGDVGHVRTLDHYLPKANFPLYSIVPGNLVPCCRDCNSEKLNAFPNVKGAQTLHPYYDDPKYFEEKWVYAEVLPTDPPTLRFFVLAPLHWAALEKQRVEAHFDAYALARKFGVEAGADIPEAIQTRKTSLLGFSPADFASYLHEKSDNLSLPINNWRRVMFKALAESNWFCSKVF